MYKNLIIALLFCLGKMTTIACARDLSHEIQRHLEITEAYEKRYQSDCRNHNEQRPAGDYFYDLGRKVLSSKVLNKEDKEDVAYAAFCLAGEQNHAGAHYERATMLDNRGENTRYNALEDYEKAARQGHGLACYRMGLYKSEGVTGVYLSLNHFRKSLDDAIFYFLQASDKLELFTESGISTPVALLSQRELERCLNVLSSNSDAFFVFNIRYSDTFTRLQEKATQGEPIQQSHVQYVMGLYYDIGLGVRKDHTKAVECFRIAAAQGNPNAVARLERMGLPLNPLKRKASETEGDTNDAGERLEETKEPSNPLKRKASDALA